MISRADRDAYADNGGNIAAVHRALHAGAAGGPVAAMAAEGRPPRKTRRLRPAVTNKQAGSNPVMTPPARLRLSLALCLPRDAVTVTVLRRVVRTALHELGVTADVSADIVLALNEACANVLDHVGRGGEYDVSVAVTAERCELRVVDVGHGFRPHQRHAAGPRRAATSPPSVAGG